MWGHKLSWVVKAIKWKWISNPFSLEGVVIFRQNLWGIDKHLSLKSSISLLWCQAHFVFQGRRGTSDSSADEQKHFSPKNIIRHEDGNDFFFLVVLTSRIDGFNWGGVLWLTWELCISFDYYHSFSRHFSIWSNLKYMLTIETICLEQPGVKGIVHTKTYYYEVMVFKPMILNENKGYGISKLQILLSSYKIIWKCIILTLKCMNVSLIILIYLGL